MAGNTLSRAVVEVHMWVLCRTTSNTVAGAGAKKSEAAAEKSRHSGAAGGAEEVN